MGKKDREHGLSPLKKDIAEIVHAKRSKRAQRIDEKTTGNISPYVETWGYHPDRYDYEGVDTADVGEKRTLQKEQLRWVRDYRLEKKIQIKMLYPDVRDEKNVTKLIRYNDEIDTTKILLLREQKGLREEIAKVKDDKIRERMRLEIKRISRDVQHYNIKKKQINKQAIRIAHLQRQSK
jgi:hypothetical protein